MTDTDGTKANQEKCSWCLGDTEYEHYHDTEWGVPQKDDRILFEKISLEGFQAGLSWITILKKRDNFRKSFDNFDIEKVGEYTDEHTEKLLQNSKIVRHRGKIESVINNSKRAKELQNEFGSLATFFWSFEPKEKITFSETSGAETTIPASTVESLALSKALKDRGWTFVGPTICYSFMQSMGIVNDHVNGCYRKEIVTGLRNKFKRPEAEV